VCEQMLMSDCGEHPAVPVSYLGHSPFFKGLEWFWHLGTSLVVLVSGKH